MSEKRGCGCGCFPPLLIVCLLLIIIFFFRFQLLTASGNFLVRNEKPVPADAAVVLAGDQYGNRTLTAGRLVREGYVPYAIISGTPRMLQNEADEDIQFAVKNGYPSSYFHPFRQDTDSTKSEAAALAASLRSQGIHRILLVTNNYHTRRANFILRKAAPWLVIHTIAAPDRFFDPSNWWHTRNGQRIWLTEWAKTLSAWVGY